MSSSSLWPSQVAVFPTDGIGLHRFGGDLRLINKAAPDAPQGQVLEPSTGRRKFRTSCTRLTLRTTAAPPREVIGSLFVNPANLPAVGLGGGTIHGRAVIAAVCQLGSAARWSILLTLENLTGSLQSAVAASLFERRDCWTPNNANWRGLFVPVYLYPGLVIRTFDPHICVCLINHRGWSEWAETFNEGARHV
jgi:hypothetical protein